jgi:hypothetical protein
MLCVGILVMYCNLPGQQAPASDYCRIARPITWAASDTRQTKEAIDSHNRVWTKLCRGK